MTNGRKTTTLESAVLIVVTIYNRKHCLIVFDPCSSIASFVFVIMHAIQCVHGCLYGALWHCFNADIREQPT